MTTQEFLKVSTQLVNDLRVWVAEASKDEALSASDLAMLNASMKIVERVTLKESGEGPAGPTSADPEFTDRVRRRPPR